MDVPFTQYFYKFINSINNRLDDRYEKMFGEWLGWH